MSREQSRGCSTISITVKAEPWTLEYIEKTSQEEGDQVLCLCRALMKSEATVSLQLLASKPYGIAAHLEGY